ncbi:protein CLT1, chloroplastic-like [Musa acuminata AAA Group]|uniref:protein CLT1, chloroplastic-like n=1 Tax=Musa acuminata AAA Group TaxID=214697 RepID=UPI0031CED785
MGGVPNLTGLSFEHSNAAIPRRIKPDVTVANSLPPRRRTDNPHVSLEVPSPTCFYAVSLSRSFSACSLLRQETSDPRNTAPRQKGASSSDFLPSPSDRDKSAFEETGVDSSPSPSPSASLPLDPIPRSAMSTCYRRILNTSISPPSDLSFRRPHLRPVSVRSAPSDGITRALRSTSVSWTPEPAVDRSLGGRGTRRGKGSPAVMCLSAMGEMIGEVEVEGQRSRAAEVLAAAAVTVVLGTGNRVLQKLALVPLKEYPFFLAQFTTFGYLVVYFSILCIRYHTGIVTDEMLSLPKTPFLAVGLLEALAAASGMAAGAVLSGASIPVLSQTFLVWQLLFSVIFLKRRYRFNQILGCLLVMVGVVITVTSGSVAGMSLKNAGIFWSLLMITSFLFQAADTILKEMIFLDAAKKLKGGSVDLFVVNSFGSAFQALFICILMPFLSKLWGIHFSQLPSYIRDGTACFLNIGSLSKGCEGAPILPVLFVIVNMAFNISLLHLLKISSAVVSCLASTFAVPLAIYAFTLPLPYIGAASSLPTGFIAGAAVLVSGLLLYCWAPSRSPSHTKLS